LGRLSIGSLLRGIAAWRRTSGRTSVWVRLGRGSISTVLLSIARLWGSTLAGRVRWLVIALSLAIGSWLIVSRGRRLVIVAGLLAIVLAWVVTAVLARRSRRGRTAGTTGTALALFVLGIVRGINGTEHQFGALKWSASYN
jgi:hypothetical protein